MRQFISSWRGNCWVTTIYSPHLRLGRWEGDKLNTLPMNTQTLPGSQQYQDIKTASNLELHHLSKYLLITHSLGNLTGSKK